MSEVVIRQGGPFIQVSHDGVRPPSPEVRRIIEAPLFYTHLDFRFGDEALDPTTGRYQTCRAERRRLFWYDAEGRYICQKGFYPRLRKLLEDKGYRVIYDRADPPKDPAVYEPDFDRVFRSFEFRPLQDTCLAQVAMHEYGVIDAVPAFGKGVVIPMIAVMYPRAKIDIVTKNREVVDTLYTRLIRHFPSVGRVGGRKRSKRRVTIYTADSLHHSDYDADIVLIDEVHQLMTDRYAKLLSRYWYSRMFGFTATKETRADNAHHRMEGLCGPTIFYLDQPTAEQYGLVVPVVVQWLDIDPGWNPVAGYKSLAARKKQGIWGHLYRNQIFAAAAQALYDENYQVLITVDTVEHGLYLKQLLPQFELCYAEQALADEKKRNRFMEAGILDPYEPPMTAERRVRLREDFERGQLQAAIATSIWRVGVSFDSLQALIRAEAGGSETEAVQGPGRVCRIDPNSGKMVGIVVDGYDMWDERSRQDSMGRRRMYAARGWVQYNADGSLWAPRERRKRVQL